MMARVVRAKNAKWLAIPTEHAATSDRRRKGRTADYKQGRNRRQVRDGVKDFVQNLSFIPGRKPGTAVLVDRDNHVVFVLVKEIRSRRRLHTEEAVMKWHAKLPEKAVKKIEARAKKLGVA